MTDQQSELVQIRPLRHADDDIRRACFVWCPGCATPHVFTVDGNGPVWEWNEDLVKPTFSPSHRVTGGFRNTICHSFLRDGVWEFLSDCTHTLAGQRVEMVKLPEWLRKEAPQ